MHLKKNVVAVVVAAAAGAALGAAARLRPPASPTAPAIAFRVAGAQGQAAGPSSRGVRARGRAQRPEEGVAIVVYVAGAVKHAGVYRLPPTARANDALAAAGGAVAAADLVAVDLAEHLEDGQEIVVPLFGAEYAEPRARGRSIRGKAPKRGRRVKRRRHRETATPDDGASDGGAPTETVNVNEADAVTLETLPGIGPSLAERLVAFRDLNGPFASADELLDVGGMTAGKVDALAPYVTF